MVIVDEVRRLSSEWRGKASCFWLFGSQIGTIVMDIGGFWR
jgi:hypothetical protein